MRSRGIWPCSPTEHTDTVAMVGLTHGARTCHKSSKPPVGQPEVRYLMLNAAGPCGFSQTQQVPRLADPDQTGSCQQGAPTSDGGLLKSTLSPGILTSSVCQYCVSTQSTHMRPWCPLLETSLLCSCRSGCFAAVKTQGRQ